MFILTAAFEAVTGLALLLSPSVPATILVGASLDTHPGLVVAHVAGATLFSLGVAFWFPRNDGQSYAAKGLLSAMLVYNVATVGIFLYVGIGLGLTLSVHGPMTARHPSAILIRPLTKRKAKDGQWWT